MKEGEDKWENISSHVQSFYSEVLNKVLPHARSAQNFVFGSPDHIPTTFESKISTENLLKDSPYFYDGKNDYIHFTDLQSLFAILSVGYIRMSEFGNLIDKHELIYGAKVFEDEPLFQFNESELEQLKENVFCFSMSEYSEKTITNPFMWEAYAKKNNGVCIRFKLTKPDPYTFIIGKVLYGRDNLAPLIQLKELILNYHPRAKMFPSEILKLIMELESLHKAKKYNIENEVRLLLRRDKSKYKEHDLETIYKDINSRDEVKYFNKLFLKGRHELLERNLKQSIGLEEDKIFNIFPQIEITNIVLGNALTISNKLNIFDLLNKTKESFKYDFIISHYTQEEEIIPFR